MRATLTLARVEGLRVLRHPATLVAWALYATWWFGGMQLADEAVDFPVLSETAQVIALAGLMPAAAALLTGHRAAVRAHHHRLDEHFDTLAISRVQRSAALLLAQFGPALLTAVVSAVAAGSVVSTPGAAGHLDVAELATGPLLVLLSGVLGVLLANVARALVTAPVIIVALFVATLTLGVPGSATGALGPVLVSGGMEPLPDALVNRPAGWHLLYLAALTMALALATLAGKSSGRQRVLGFIAAGAVLVLAGCTVPPQTAGPSPDLRRRRTLAIEHPNAQQQCRTVDAVAYCAFPEYLPWIKAWAEVTRGVRRGLVGPVPGSVTSVRQRVNAGADSNEVSTELPLTAWAKDDGASGTVDPVPVGVYWARQDADLQFAIATAYQLVTARSILAGSRPGQAHPDPAKECDARWITILWIAARATPRTNASFNNPAMVSADFWVVQPLPEFNGLTFVPLREVELVKALRRLPAATGEARVKTAWPVLIDPRTTVEQAAQALGLPVSPASADEQEACRR